MTETIIATDVPSRWADIFAAILTGRREFLITDGRQIKAVIMDQAQYHRLVTLAKRDARRRHALALPLAAAEHPAVWDAGFESLERISEKFASLSDEEMDALFGAALAQVRSAG